jgi:hypothetical protein
MVILSAQGNLFIHCIYQSAANKDIILKSYNVISSPYFGVEGKSVVSYRRVERVSGSRRCLFTTHILHGGFISPFFDSRVTVMKLLHMLHRIVSCTDVPRVLAIR